MAEEIDEGLAYLQALKQSTPATASPLPARDLNSSAARAPVLNSASALAFGGGEKRRSPRYKCEGSLEMCEAGSESRTYATCTDVSMHGCYVEATTTYPVGTNLHMKLQANGSQVQSKGCVRVTYPSLGMGIAFVEMSEEDRSRLKDLLRAVSRPSVILGPGIASAGSPHSASESIPLPSDATAALRDAGGIFRNPPTAHAR
jgi:PilZ domain